MPQKQSAKKALRQSEKKRIINLRYKRIMRTLIKEFQVLVKKGDKKKAGEMLPSIYKAIDKAAKKNIIKKGNASRKKSRLTVSMNKITKVEKKVNTPAKKEPKKA